MGGFRENILLVKSESFIWSLSPTGYAGQWGVRKFMISRDHQKAILSIVLLLSLGSGLLTTASAADKYLWQQVSEEGFGDLTNDYVRALANYTPPGSSTAYLYAGTINYNFTPPNGSILTDGCEVWRTNGTEDADGKHVWEQVVGPTGTQLRAGFREGCSEVRWMQVIPSASGNLLWVGTTNPFVGCEIWVTNGTAWKRANLPGFTNNRNNTAARGVAIFNTTLFVGTLNPNEGAGVWRYNRSLDTVDFATLDTAANRTKWEQVNEPGFGEPEINTGVGVLETFGASPEYLYAGTWNGTLEQLLDAIAAGWDFEALAGSQVWRTNGTVNGAGPQVIWEQVDTGGFGNTYNGGILSSIVFNGSLYMGTMNFENGAEIWRTSNGLAWEQVTGSGFMDSAAGFKAFGNGYMWCMFNYSGMLFIGTLNPILGCQVWRSASGDAGTFEQVNVNGMNEERTIPLANLAGFPVMGIDQYGVRSFAEYEGNLYLGTASFGAFLDMYLKNKMNITSNFSDYVGGEVWRTNLTTYTPPDLEVNKGLWDPEQEEWVSSLSTYLGETVRCNLTIHLNGTYNLSNVTFIDFLSPSLKYVNNATLRYPNGTLAAREPWVMELPLFGGGTLVLWNLSEVVLAPSQTLSIEYDARLVYPVDDGPNLNFLVAKGQTIETGDYGYGWDCAVVDEVPSDCWFEFWEDGFIFRVYNNRTWGQSVVISNGDKIVELRVLNYTLDCDDVERFLIGLDLANFATLPEMIILNYDDGNVDMQVWRAGGEAPDLTVENLQLITGTGSFWREDLGISCGVYTFHSFLNERGMVGVSAPCADGRIMVVVIRLLEMLQGYEGDPLGFDIISISETQSITVEYLTDSTRHLKAVFSDDLLGELNYEVGAVDFVAGFGDALDWMSGVPPEYHKIVCELGEYNDTKDDYDVIIEYYLAEDDPAPSETVRFDRPTSRDMGATVSGTGSSLGWGSGPEYNRTVCYTRPKENSSEETELVIEYYLPDNDTPGLTLVIDPLTPRYAGAVTAGAGSVFGPGSGWKYELMVSYEGEDESGKTSLYVDYYLNLSDYGNGSPALTLVIDPLTPRYTAALTAGTGSNGAFGSGPSYEKVHQLLWERHGQQDHADRRVLPERE